MNSTLTNTVQYLRRTPLGARRRIRRSRVASSPPPPPPLRRMRANGRGMSRPRAGAPPCRAPGGGEFTVKGAMPWMLRAMIWMLRAKRSVAVG
eukprot:1191534-Prorocentrum_minimum.AAC.3